MTTLLIVEDEPIMAETLAYNLRREGYEVLIAADGESGLEIARTESPDLIILDVMLPGLDGLSVCRILRKDTTVPIILLTARSSEMDRIIGLEIGADDYIVKPFSLGELMARVRAVLRRAPGERTSPDILAAGPLKLDLSGRRATVSGREIPLSQREFDLLSYLMRNPGVVLSRDTIVSRVWGDDYYGDMRTVDVHIRWLREKIEADPASPRLITTVRGIGYRFEADAPAD